MQSLHDAFVLVEKVSLKTRAALIVYKILNQIICALIKKNEGLKVIFPQGLLYDILESHVRKSP